MEKHNGLEENCTICKEVQSKRIESIKNSRLLSPNSNSAFKLNISQSTINPEESQLRKIASHSLL
jgi:hypothetical protein